MRFTNKVALVTGASKGIGKATALRFAKEGAKLVVCDRDDAVAETVAEVRLQGGGAIGFAVDVSRPESIEAMVRSALATFGHIDILINNACVMADSRLKTTTGEQFDHFINIDLRGIYNCTRAVVEAMIENKGGVVLNASSTAGIDSAGDQACYTLSKFGVIGLVKTWAHELGRHGIRVNAVCPGLIATHGSTMMPGKAMRALEERVPLGRLGRPEDIASTFAFLASDEASYINGAVINVCGGMTI